MSLPPLRTERMRLEPVEDHHLGLLAELNSDPEVMRFILGRPATVAETEVEWAQRREHQSDSSRGLGYWVGFEEEVFAGWWSASSFTADPALSGIGYRLRAGVWGRGLATEGALAVLAQAFSVPEVRRVVASTMAVNERSRSVLAKLGMRHTKTWVQEWDDPIPGSEQGEVLYELTREEWRATRP